MNKKRSLSTWLLLIFTAISTLSLIKCADSGSATQDTNETTLIIENYSFVPSEFSLPSGATLTIINHDDIPHLITHQSGADAFDQAGLFEVIVPANSTNTLTLPEADSGEVYYFYCQFFNENMTPPNGQITIE